MGSIIRKEVMTIAIYKFIEDFIRYILGIFLIISNFDLHKLLLYIFRKELTDNASNSFFTFAMNHMQQTPTALSKFLAIFLIFFSLLEISFLIGFIFRKKWGGIGFFLMQFLWIPVDLLIISKVLLFSKIITLLLEAIIIWFMIRLFLSPQKYFKK